ncbi:hypothetical protein AVEN_190894-1 [Araneus ventricosus]|uniref:Uncharacterized protein n=1 Tax=Araneus ventricosus TaxID=182803 RepID=A0A4Y2CQJ2_ARAVE|nr:hypothetical protein AVEN_190894-1 [Araneus ventricosus]
MSRLTKDNAPPGKFQDATLWLQQHSSGFGVCYSLQSSRSKYYSPHANAIVGSSSGSMVCIALFIIAIDRDLYRELAIRRVQPQHSGAAVLVSSSPRVTFRCPPIKRSEDTINTPRFFSARFNQRSPIRHFNV